MAPLVDNPLGILTFIAAPAILTNASSVMALGTSNRFARAIDRARQLSRDIQAAGIGPNVEKEMYVRQLRSAERRAQLLVRALTGFYVSVGSFGAASLVSLLAALFYASHYEAAQQIALIVALAAGVCGVGGLVAGSGLLVFETRMTLRILREETERMQRLRVADTK